MPGREDDAVWRRPEPGSDAPPSARSEEPSSAPWTTTSGVAEWSTPATTWTGPDDQVIASQASPLSRRRPGLPIAAAVAALVVIGGAVAIAVAVTGSSSTLAGETPAQILATSLAAAQSAGSFHVVSTSGSDAGEEIAFDIGPNAAVMMVSAAGSNAGAATGGLTVLLVGGRPYVKVTGPGVPATYAGRWMNLPATDAQFGPTVKMLTPSSFLDTFVALTGTITRVPGPANSTDVFLRGTVRQSSVLGTQADAGTLEISGAAPFYPVKLSYTDPNAGSQVYAFSGWGEHVAATAPSGPISPPPNLFGQPPGGSSGGAGDVATESNLQTALTGAKVYYTENNQTYAGLDPSTFASIDTGLTAVPGSQPSTAANVVSLSSSATWVVLAGWSPATHDCLAIVDATAAARLDGAQRLGTYYLRTPGATEASCRAATYAGAGLAAGATKISTNGFFSSP